MNQVMGFLDVEFEYYTSGHVLVDLENWFAKPAEKNMHVIEDVQGVICR